MGSNEDYWKINQGESFWEDVLEHFLRERLERIYSRKKAYKKFQKWLGGNDFRSAVIQITDMPSEPFVVKLFKDHYEAGTVKRVDFHVDLELETDHITLMSFGYNPIYLLPSILLRMVKVKSGGIKDSWMFLRFILL